MAKKDIIIRGTIFGPVEEWNGSDNFKCMLFAGPENEDGQILPGGYLVFSKEKYAVDGNDIIGAYMSLMDLEDCDVSDPDKLEFISGKKIKRDPETGEKKKKQSTLQWAESIECTNGDYLLVVNDGGATGQIPYDCIQQLLDTTIDYLVLPEDQGQFVPIET